MLPRGLNISLLTIPPIRFVRKLVALLTIITVISSFSCLHLGCRKETPPEPLPCGGIDPGIVSESPYDSPIWHPSGQFIGFNHVPLTRVDYLNGEQCWGVQHFADDSAGFWLINVDGTNKRRIFPYKLQGPVWSPDGQWIAFVAGAQIFKMRFTGTTFDTTTLFRLTTEGRNFFPAWSPDGEWVAYDRSLADSSGPGGIWVMKNDGTLKRFVFSASFPAWHPNGNILMGVIGTSPTSIWTRFVRYNLIQSIIVDTLSAVSGSDNRHPRYSSSDTTIAFWSKPSTSGMGNLWLMDKNGSNLNQATSEGVDVSFGIPFTWSQDGSQIVYTKYRPDDWNYRNGVLWMLTVSTGEKRQLTFNP